MLFFFLFFCRGIYAHHRLRKSLRLFCPEISGSAVAFLPRNHKHSIASFQIAQKVADIDEKQERGLPLQIKSASRSLWTNASGLVRFLLRQTYET